MGGGSARDDHDSRPCGDRGAMAPRRCGRAKRDRHRLRDRLHPRRAPRARSVVTARMVLGTAARRRPLYRCHHSRCGCAPLTPFDATLRAGLCRAIACEPSRHATCRGAVGLTRGLGSKLGHAARATGAWRDGRPGIHERQLDRTDQVTLSLWARPCRAQTRGRPRCERCAVRLRFRSRRGDPTAARRAASH